MGAERGPYKTALQPGTEVLIAAHYHYDLRSYAVTSEVCGVTIAQARRIVARWPRNHPTVVFIARRLGYLNPLGDLGGLRRRPVSLD